MAGCAIPTGRLTGIPQHLDADSLPTPPHGALVNLPCGQNHWRVNGYPMIASLHSKVHVDR